MGSWLCLLALGSRLIQSTVKIAALLAVPPGVVMEIFRVDCGGENARRHPDLGIHGECQSCFWIFVEDSWLVGATRSGGKPRLELLDAPEIVRTTAPKFPPKLRRPCGNNGIAAYPVMREAVLIWLTRIRKFCVASAKHHGPDEPPAFMSEKLASRKCSQPARTRLQRGNPALSPPFQLIDTPPDTGYASPQ